MTGDPERVLRPGQRISLGENVYTVIQLNGTKLREITPGAETDPRVIAAIETTLAEPRGRSTVARSVMFTELQRRLDDEYGPGTVPVPHKRTLYRLMVHMDRGRRNFVSEASRRTAVNRPDRPFTPSDRPAAR